jgi:hypothetical protein
VAVPLDAFTGLFKAKFWSIKAAFETPAEARRAATKSVCFNFIVFMF